MLSFSYILYCTGTLFTHQEYEYEFTLDMILGTPLAYVFWVFGSGPKEETRLTILQGHPLKKHQETF
jgi:hypothetical protein